MPGTGLRLLIVDDQEMFAMTLAAVVSRLNYNLIGSAATAERALELALDTMPDVVLMDLHLKGPRDGVETAKAVIEATGAQIIFLTGASGDHDIARMKALKPAAVLHKPFRRTALADALVLAAQRMRSQPVAVESG